ncbi:MAG TPA: PEP/pyruvate-binding domain-containing protein [Dissulfurispiraceae bacterium]|nr:PEP/pyruvate-binding domain-containing protein [Dissulfurispiraceae bacterium]
MNKGLANLLSGIHRKVKGAVCSPLSFQDLFSRFRHVLSIHNSAIEIIADMGEKLSGEYLFDTNYIESAYDRLAAAVSNSIKSFDQLTNGKYSGLHEAFVGIDGRIAAMLSDSASSSGERVVFIEDTTWDMYYEIGGKNAGLAELKNVLGLTVPDAFFVTTRSFDEFIEFNGLDDGVKQITKKSRMSEDDFAVLRAAIVNGKIPPALDKEFDAAIKKMKMKCGVSCSVAVRSSAEEEDGKLSFAGQFDTVLNVPLQAVAVKKAYKKVVASLFSLHSMAYQKRFGYDASKMKMAVGCVAMVEAASSGVAYSVDPSGPAGRQDAVLISANWGLGKTIVEGLVEADIYRIKKGSQPETVDMRCGMKEAMTVFTKGGGIDTIAVPTLLRSRMVLDAGLLNELALKAQLIEKHFRRPQDIEWAIDPKGKMFILQSRELRMDEGSSMQCPSGADNFESRTVLMKNKGTGVQKGISTGRVFVAMTPDDAKDIPKGAILVSKRDFSVFVRLMNDVSAIITDIGTPTSHMASLSREFRIPTIVNTDDATRILGNGMEVTVVVDDEGTAVYEGIAHKVRECLTSNAPDVTEGHEYLKKRYVLRHISPLNLIEPLHDNFLPEQCKTIHDILRFIHEKSIMELVDCARHRKASMKGYSAVTLDLPVPAGIVMIDMGGGLAEGVPKVKKGPRAAAAEAEITSIPLKAILRGMTHPGAWHNEAVPLKMKDFFVSMTRIPDIHSESMSSPVMNIAVASREYVNLSLKFGYHFNIVDCYCSENPRNNHVYFRFSGGATDISQRSRRVQFIASVLKDYGFTIWTKGDLLIARIANIGRDRMETVLDQLGRLIAFARKLDALLRDDATVRRYTRRFKSGNYELRIKPEGPAL